jgi:LETM1 and EF-hand domain-containing protein 1, mitochondrial
MLRVVCKDAVTLQRIESRIRQPPLLKVRLSTQPSPAPRPITPGPANVPPSAPVQRRSRPDLKPGPLRPQTLSRSSILSRTNSPPLETVDEGSSHSPNPTDQVIDPPKPNEQLSITQMVDRDIQHAESLGILQPAPANASSFKRFFHKGKELAVRIVSVLSYSNYSMF